MGGGGLDGVCGWEEDRQKGECESTGAGYGVEREEDESMLPNFSLYGIKHVCKVYISQLTCVNFFFRTKHPKSLHVRSAYDFSLAIWIRMLYFSTNYFITSLASDFVRS